MRVSSICLGPKGGREMGNDTSARDAKEVESKTMTDWMRPTAKRVTRTGRD